jgi:hypothetical protein
MDLPISQRTNWMIALCMGLIGVVVLGHVNLADLVQWVQWLITDVIEPAVGLDDRVLG